MSFLGGAECSTGRNPLAQFTKHVSDDKSLQRDRMAGGVPVGREAGGMRSMPADMTAADQQMDKFFNQQAAQSPFTFGSMHDELLALQGPQTAPPGAAPSLQWAAQFPMVNPQEQARMEAAFRGRTTVEFSSAEFARFQGAAPQADISMNSSGPQAQFYRPQQFQGYQHFNQGMPFTAHNPYQVQQPLQAPVIEQQQNFKGKGKEVEAAEWERQFQEIQQGTEEEVSQKIDEELHTHSESTFGDFQSVWEGIKQETGTNATTVDWANEFDSSNPWTAEESNTNSMPRLGEYLFEPDNPYLQQANPFAEGKRLMETGGNLSLAALAFEAAVQQEPNHIEAWTELGGCQAANEKETPAIRALEHALKLDEGNLRALMGLAVSYTNEGYDTTAYSTLERWLAAKYPQIANAAPPAPGSTMDRRAIHDRVTSLFIQAAQLSPEGTAMDSDVQVGLGVLFYGDEEYDKAVDCFTAALTSTNSTTSSPEHLLWNRLGATLANSGRSEEAIEAYERALTINPQFVRARYNLGVSCINIGCFEQAAQHLLGALSMHKEAEEQARKDAGNVGVDPTRIVHNQSTNLFDTLRRVFSQMGRRDLADEVRNGMDINVFRYVAPLERWREEVWKKIGVGD
ncbi:Peroxisomal membrane signal receptor PTS1 [Rhizina undulata]